MKKLAIAMVLLLVPAFSADAASHRHKHQASGSTGKVRPFQPASAGPGSPVTRLPVAPDTFRA
ncbi:MAG: hypothetical protein JOY90_26925 [Bradyrhizobium sp.]|uniref:hypothetical protein n=1 Tax=Bradyrhizobium sp. TaxID=376 RepID=UPI001DB5110D|nr:hypothetical protein [Bradyrhizobium sp.]MBV9564049.1 hypothetical protein [Bradyrhizobium sp.]